jgi:hypothetical protein
VSASPSMPLRASPSPINTPTVRSASVSRLQSPELNPRLPEVPPACSNNVGDGDNQTLGPKNTISVQTDRKTNGRTSWRTSRPLDNGTGGRRLDSQRGEHATNETTERTKTRSGLGLREMGGGDRKP